VPQKDSPADKARAFIKRRCHPEYPPHVSLSQTLLWAFASWGTLRVPAAACGLVAYSDETESLKRVIPFPNSIGRDLRLLLYAGIHSSDYYVPLDNVAWIQSLLGLPLNQRGQVLLDDASTIASLVVSPSHLLDGIATSGS
jgi:hypothetical protein